MVALAFSPAIETESVEKSVLSAIWLTPEAPVSTPAFSTSLPEPSRSRFCAPLEPAYCWRRRCVACPAPPFLAVFVVGVVVVAVELPPGVVLVAGLGAAACWVATSSIVEREARSRAKSTCGAAPAAERSAGLLDEANATRSVEISYFAPAGKFIE